MADNITITEGVGTTAATDDCAGVHFGKMKIVDGTADSTTVVAVDVGAKANALRVAPANDITDGTYIGDIKFGEALPAGTAAIGKLAANSGVDIGDVDILSIAAGDNNIGNVDIVTVPAPLNVVGGGTEATALRVTLANDSTGVITVDGTVTANLSATDNAVLDTIDADTGAIKLATEIMDDWDATHDSAASADGPQLMGAYDSTKPTAVADGDAVRVLTDSYGRLLPGLEPEWFNAVYDSADATGEGETVKAATAAKKIYIMSYVISSDVEGWIKLQDEDSNALTGKFWLKAGGGVAITLPPGAPLVLNVANKALEVIAEAAGDISVTVTGYLAP